MFLSSASKMLEELKIPIEALSEPGAKLLIKSSFRRFAHKKWMARVNLQPTLFALYGNSEIMEMQPYLKIPNFRGRRILTKLRLDDLLLNAASFLRKNPKNCDKCNLHYETRKHFVLGCKWKGYMVIREHHKQTVPALNALDPNDAFKQIILIHYSPYSLDTSAPAIGNFLADMWRERERGN